MNHSFATADLRLKESEVPDMCPMCGHKLTKGVYYVECENWDDCEWCAEIIEEESVPTRYDQVQGIIIK